MNKKINFSPYLLVKDALNNLKAKENKVVTERFGIGSDKKTLAAIGSSLNLSRERIRQIERESLLKISVFIAKKHPEKVESIINIMEREQGILHKDEAETIILGEKPSQNDLNSLHLILSLIKEIEKIEKDDYLNDSWILATVPKKEVVAILKDWASYLEKNNRPAKIEVLLEAHPHHSKHKISFLSSLPRISKQIIKNYKGDFGLSLWPEFNPKNVRDKIYYVLRKNQAPMHFAEIGRAIKNENFDKKKVILATIHNELISDNRFVLIGRGIYALKEWGYESGTVKEIIQKILQKSGGAMTLSDIFKEVSKQRQVRKNTILINLQTGKEFKKISSDKYILKSRG